MQVQIDVKNELKTAAILVNRTQYNEAMQHILQLTNQFPRVLFDALTQLFKQLRNQFNNNHIRVMIAELYMAKGFLQEALEEMEDAYQIDPKFSQTYHVLAKLYGKINNKKQIQLLFEDAINQQIYNSSILDLLPKIYLEEKNTVKNIQLFEKLISHDPQKLHYYKVLAELFRSVQQYDKASQVLEKMVGISPKLSQDAAKLCSLMIRSCPMNFIVRQRLIQFYWKSFDPEKAHTHLQELCRLDASYTPLAISDYKDALTIFPNHTTLMLGLATLLIETESYSESVTVIDTVYQAAPNTPQIKQLLELILERCPQQFLAIRQMIKLYFDLGQIEVCLNYIQQLITPPAEEETVVIDILEQIKTRYEDYRHQCMYLATELYFNIQNYKGCLPLIKALKETEFQKDVMAIEIKIQLNLDDISKAQKLCLLAMVQFPFGHEFHDIFSEIQSKIMMIQINSITMMSDKDLFELGLLRLRQGEFYEAIEKLQNIPLTSAFSFKSNVLMSRCYLELGQYQMALKYIKRGMNDMASSNAEDQCHLLFFQSLIYIQHGNYEEALQVMRKIQAINPGYCHIEQQIARYEPINQSGIRGLAVGVVKASNSFSPWHVIAVTNPEESDAARTQKMNMSFALPHNNKGVNCILQDNIVSAKSAFKLALQLDPTLTISYINLAVVYFLESKFQDSLDQLEIAKQINPKLDLIDQLMGLNYQALMRYDDAIASLRLAHQKNPNNDVVCINLGDLYNQLNDIESAISCWKLGLASPFYFYLIQRRLIYLNINSVQLKEWLAPQSNFLGMHIIDL